MREILSDALHWDFQAGLLVSFFLRHNGLNDRRGECSFPVSLVHPPRLRIGWSAVIDGALLQHLPLAGFVKERNERLSLLIQTICGTGIRVSELQYITVEAVKCGEAVVSCKAKTRSVFIVKELKQKLLRYAAEQGIKNGMIFVTRTGKPLSRTNIWREMKALCIEANVNPQKVFPHNLRHLFARVFYGIEKDIAKLADILGHSSINTTRIYIISTGTEHRRRMENMHLIL